MIIEKSNSKTTFNEVVFLLHSTNLGSRAIYEMIIQKAVPYMGIN